jgi:hypothetical protein
MTGGPVGVNERKLDVNKAIRKKLEPYSVQAEATNAH